MATPLLGLALPVTGSLNNQWGDTVNNSITSLLDSAVAGTTTLSTDADVTLTTTLESANQARAAIIRWTAAGTVTRVITAPAQSKAYVVINSSSTQSIKLVGVGPTTGITIAPNEKCVAAWSGSDFVKVSSSSAAAGTVTSVGFTGGIVSVATSTTTPAMTVAGTSGGIVYFSSTSTWASSAALAANALVIGGGAGSAPSTVSAITTDNTYLQLGSQIPLRFGNSSNANYVALRGPATPAANVTWTLPAADGTNGQVLITNGTGTLSWSTVSGGGGGIVNSVGVTSANGFAGTSSGGSTPSLTLSTTVTGVLKGNGTSISAATSGTDYAPATSGTSILYGNGSGGFSNVTIGTNLSFVSGTLSATGSAGGVTSFSAGSTGFTPNTATTGAITLAGTLAVGYGGTGVTTSTGSGSNVLSTSPTLVTPALGTPTSGTLTNCTSIPVNQATGTLPLANGGTGQTTKAAAFDALSPMTTLGDIIYGGASGTGTRLGVGSAGQVLTVVSGAPAWAAAGGGPTGTNTFYGSGAGNGISTGTDNTGIGYRALYTLSTGNSATAVGYQAMFSNNIGGGTAVGYQALYANTGPGNTAIGYRSLYANTTGGYNVGIGDFALNSNTTGGGNTVINPNDSNGTNTPVFNPTTESNRFVCGSSNVINAYVKVAWTVVSDIRDKADFGDVPHGLDFVTKLNPIAFRYKTNRNSTETDGPVRYGFSAQEVLALEGDTPVIVDAEDPETLRFNDQSLIAVLVNAIKELTARVKELEAKL
jgi:hypothetical protein